ncbi:MAG: hypothetical protein ISQ70_01555 [Pirellulales bacterium]|nr:hypothetical protein [Pirellulales bacterium]
MKHKTPQIILLVAGGLLLGGSVVLYLSRSWAYDYYMNSPAILGRPREYTYEDIPIISNYYPTSLIGAIAFIAGIATWNLAGRGPSVDRGRE